MCTCPDRRHKLRDSLGRYRRHGTPFVHPRTRLRDDYLAYLDACYLAAEAATRGHLLTAEGRRRGVRPSRWFALRQGPSEAYMSPELAEWWATSRPLTESDYLAQLSEAA